MSGNKRERQLARAKYERQSARRSTKAQRRRRRQTILIGVLVAVVVLASVGFAVLSTVGHEDVAASDGIATGTAGPAPSVAGLDCTAPGTPRADNVTLATAPTPDAVSAAATSITFSTNCGDIVVDLDHGAPRTVASEVLLAGSGFYDQTSCHRLTNASIFVLQCGDPRGDGSGGPGYTVPDENLPTDAATTYPAGTVAMANAGPDTSGSQFFIVYQDTVLPADYTIWGTVTSGLDIVQKIASAGTSGGTGDGPPAQPVFIESASVQTS